MVAYLVLRSPKKFKSGHRHHETAVPSEHPPNFSQRGSVIINVFQHVKHCDEVETIISKGKNFTFQASDFSDAANSAKSHCCLISINPLRIPEAREISKHGPGSASHIEDLRLPASVPHDLLDYAQEQSSAPNEPPMLVLHFKIFGIEAFFQGRRAYHTPDARKQSRAPMKQAVRLATCLVFIVATVHGVAAPDSTAPPFFKGVTVSCQTWGREWQTPEMAQTLDELKSLGVSSFAIHPYARITNDGHVRTRMVAENRHITVPLDWARERGLSVMLVPHIAYWGSKFSWRGEIKFESAEEWDRFFSEYQTWIVEMAGLAEAHGAALFCVGLEFTHAQKYEQRWREIIAAVRAVYRGKITYGANWNEYEAVKFWDAVDYIGVLAYFPLTQTADPSAAELAGSWEKRGAELERFSKRNGGKQFLFVEIGYNQSAGAAAEPWSFKTGGEHASEIQQRCLDAALGLTSNHPFLAGMFLWKWFPELPHDEEEDFRLQTPAIKALIAQHWKEPM